MAGHVSQRVKKARPSDRPLARCAREELARQLQRAIAQQDGRAGAHCIHELWMRGDLAVDVQRMIDLLWKQAAASIPDCRADRRGRSNLYLVLLDYRDSRRDPYGVYVGMTDYPPATRFDQHKAGIRAAGSVLRRGLEVLHGPVVHLQGIARSEAERIESELAEALRAAGLFVQGGH
jgi:hypothetical protein